MNDGVEVCATPFETGWPLDLEGATTAAEDVEAEERRDKLARRGEAGVREEDGVVEDEVDISDGSTGGAGREGTRNMMMAAKSQAH